MRSREILPFAGAAIIGLAVVLLPGPDTDWSLFALAAALTLAILPIVWLALYRSRRQLLIGLAALTATLLVPFLIFGEPRSPAAVWRSTLLWLVVATLTGLAIQSLVVRMRATRDRLSRVLQNATETAIVATGADGVITVFNRGAERMLGYAADDVVGTATPAIMHDADELAAKGSELGAASLPELFAALGPEPQRWTYVRKDGSRHQVSLTVTTERDDAGAVTGFLAVATDIGERPRAEPALEAERDFSAAVVDSAGSLVMVLDAQGRIERFNRACELLTGRTEAEARGLLAPELVADPEDAARVAALLREATPADYPISFEVEWAAAGGARRLIAWSNTCMVDQDGRIAYLVAVGTDVTERREALREAIAASHAKSDFLANMSHELRTPLNGVIGMLELLLDTELDADQREYARTASTSGDALLGVINDILDFSKIEAGMLELDASEFDLRQVVEDATEILAHQAHGKGIELTAWIDEQVPPLVRGDSVRLRQVLTNLLSNAVKFTPSGEVSVRVGAEPAGDDALLLRAEVVDTGVGIEPARIASLFDPFSQEDSSTTRRYGGTGLGLTISRQLVELMGGELSAESVPGEGSTFRFTAVLRRASGRPTRRARRGMPEGLRVLVVDDSATNRRIVRGYLDPRVTTCDEAESGEDALVMMHSAANAGAPYALVVLDCHMPGMDGVELVAAIRATPSLRSARLVMLTSAAAHRSAARDVEVDAQLTKPVRRASLLETVAEALDGIDGPRPAAPPTPERAAPPVAHPGGRVLVAEDNPVNQLVIQGMLAKRGYDADLVTSGQAALETLDREQHLAVLMDVQMPVLDGYETTRRIRNAENGTAHIPIIAMTAGALEGDRDAALDAGMDDYLSKPLRPDQLDAVLERWIGARAPAATAKPILDESRIRSFRETYPDIVERLVALFVDTTPPLLDELVQASERGDVDALPRLAHKLRSSCDNVGALRMSAACRALEAAPGEHRTLVEELRAAYPPTLAELRGAGGS